VNEEYVGGMNIYSRRPATFDDAAVRTAQDLSAYAGIVLNNANLYFNASSRAEHMQAAMASRATIEQAKGILMGGRRCDENEAFDILVRLSQQSGRKLRDVAAALVQQATQ
jgi:GAF domain-containing protein